MNNQLSRQTTGREISDNMHRRLTVLTLYNATHSPGVKGTELNGGGHRTEKVYTWWGDTAHIF